MQKTKIVKQIGVFMDHAGASLFTPVHDDTVPGEHSRNHHLKHDGQLVDGHQHESHKSTSSESHQHNKEQNELHAFYKNLAQHLKPYDEILVMGPTTAAAEFHNFCTKHGLLNGHDITIEKSNYLTSNQLEEKINHFFKTKLR